MIGGLFKTTSLAALAATAFVFSGSVTPASAADLGGNCCADLEERVAELEATTVRKGNRKVSVTLSGFVAHNVMWWDDGNVSDTYIGDGGNYGSRFRFVGTAKISPTMTAGFLYEFGISNNSISSSDQENRVAACSTVAGQPVPAGCATTSRDNGDDLGGGVTLRDTTVWLQHSQIGKIKVGHGSTATDNLVLIDLGGMAGAATPDVGLYGGGMRITNSNGTYSRFTWQQAFTGTESWDTTRRNHVLYETPTLAGFSVQTAVAEDNFWDIALRYAGEHHGFRMAFGIGYLEDTEFNTRYIDNAFAPTGAGVVRCDLDCDRKETQLKGSASVLHVATGLFATVAAGRREQEDAQRLVTSAVTGSPTGTNNFGDRDAGFWWLALGVRRNFFGFGDTVLYGEYGQHKDGLTLVRETVSSSEVTNWGLGINQYIDAAAAEVFIAYKNYDVDFVEAGVGQSSDFQTVLGGMRVNF